MPVTPATTPSIAAQLGQFVADAAWDAVPEAVRAAGRRSLLNFIGCALGVARTDPIDAAMRVLLPLAGAQRVTVMGRAETLDMLGAAFVNAIAGNLLDYDDTHLRTVIHPTAPVAPAVLALAEQRGLSGQAALHAFILGAEIECRLGNAVSPTHYARGWHITATCGVFGATAACARLLGLDTEQTAHALGIAASQSAGLVENLPNGAKNVGVGNAARNGLFAALLAQQGYDAAPAAIEGAFGWARATGDVPVVAEITGSLGAQWELQSNTFKPYPCGIVMHAVIDACLALREKHGIAADAIAEVVIAGDQLLLDRGDRPVSGERDARVSIHHCAAVALLFGKAGLTEFTEAVVQDPAVAALRARVIARVDAASPRGAATATLRTLDGRTFSATVTHARGSVAAPLSDEAIAAKLHELAAFGGFRGPVDAIIAAVSKLETLAEVGALMRMLAG